MKDAEVHIAKWKKNPNYVTFWKRLNYRDIKKMSGS